MLCGKRRTKFRGDISPTAFCFTSNSKTSKTLSTGIFYRNSINGGYLVPLESTKRLVDEICTGDDLTLDIPNRKLTNHTTGDTWELQGLGDVAPILEAGGIFEYAKKAGMLPA